MDIRIDASAARTSGRVLRTARRSLIAGASTALMMVGAPVAHASELVVLDSFPTGLGTLVSCAASAGGGPVWTYVGFGSTLHRFDVDGAPLGTVPRPGGGGDDADLEIPSVPFTFGDRVLAAGTAIYIEGESGTAELHAIDPATGDLIATLPTEFGNSHVVGGAYHPQRDTFFLVQDSVPGGTNANRVAEVHAATGEVIQTFQTTGVFSVFYGDIDVDPLTGNLLLVSSVEPTIGVFTSEGKLVAELALPAGVSGLSGIGVDDATGDIWTSSTNGTIRRLGTCAGDFNKNGAVEGADLGILLGAWDSTDPITDLNGDGVVDGADLGVLLSLWGDCS